MRWLADRLARLRWMAVPVAVYLVVTLALPLANGAAGREEFAGHAGWVVAGCLVMVTVALLAGALVDGLLRRPRRAPRAAGGRTADDADTGGGA